MRILLWHVHGSWTDAFVQGRHEYLLPVLPDRGPDGRGRARTWDWPASVRELPPHELRAAAPDVVVLQHAHEAQLLRDWTGLRAGTDVPAVYLEHNAPTGHAVCTVHPVLTDPALRGLPLVHVTHFNAMAWDIGAPGAVRSTVVPHGVVDPGPLYTGEDASLGVVINEPVRRTRVAGTDIVLRLAASVPVHVYGIDSHLLADPLLAPGPPLPPERCHDLPQREMHRALGRHRAYLHPYRWTSLGLALVEAMTLGMPVLVVASTEAPAAVPADAGLVSADIDALHETARRWLTDPDEARQRGAAARRHALTQFGLSRFLSDWDRILQEVVAP